jgi:8-oxo-dGTP pyrophosphatase MutT (NUDIX family)
MTAFFSPFVYLVSFVFRLFPVNYGRAELTTKVTKEKHSIMELTREYISQRLQEAGAGSTASQEYAEMAVDESTRLKCAAVLVPLVFQDDEWHVLFTRRTDRLESHKGQVSFPGGACDEGETTPEQTALREAEEEIGIRPADVQVLGRLNRMVTISSFRVSPIVGVIPFPYAFKVANVEVARVFTIPLLWLANRNNYWEFSFGNSDRSLIAYHPYDGELLWGATARMTVNFLKTLGLLETA